MSTDTEKGYQHYVAASPDDYTDEPYVSNEIYVGGDGNMAVVDADSGAVSHVGVLAGHTYELRARRINATGTTATGIVFFHENEQVGDHSGPAPAGPPTRGLLAHFPLGTNRMEGDVEHSGRASTSRVASQLSAHWGLGQTQMFCERAYYDLAHQVGGGVQAWAFGDCDEDGHGSFRDLGRWVREPVAHYALGSNQMGGPRIHRELGSDVWHGLQAWWPLDKGSEVLGEELYDLANAASIDDEKRGEAFDGKAFND